MHINHVQVISFFFFFKNAEPVSFSPNEQISFLGLQGGQAFFSAVKEGDLVVFATHDEQDRSLWVQAMYRATGQSYKPVPPAQNQQHNCRGGNIQKDAPASLLSRLTSTLTRVTFTF